MTYDDELFVALAAIRSGLAPSLPVSRNLVDDLLAAMSASPGRILDLGDAIIAIVGGFVALESRDKGTAA